MSRLKWLIKTKIIMIITFSLIMGPAMPVAAQFSLTQEEKDYIAKEDVIKAVSLYGAAPIQYADSKGEVRGISKRVLDQVSDMTGLIFEYKLYDTLDEALNSDSDIVFGIPPNYAPSHMVLSQPYLKSETILYINSSLNINNLEDKIYAAVRGSDLPEGVNEENSIYFDTREESLDAVESGQADYGYGNAYSVAFYTLQNTYNNITTIPIGKEPREYSIGFIKDNEVLFSIIDKSLNSIDETQMQTLILDVTSHIERKITFPMIIDTYGREVFSIIFLAMVTLMLGFIVNVRIKNKLKIQNKRYEILSQISNEYLYEYYVRTNHLELAKKSMQLFGHEDNFNKAKIMLKDALVNNELDEEIPRIELPLFNGEVGIFKAVNSRLYDDKGRIYSIIGKLIDITEEVAEKQELITRSERDGLTGLYNAITTKELINKNIKNWDKNKIEALIVIDCDKLKDINDRYGHLQGDKILMNIGKGLRNTFRQTDIIGRIGGDEFCVYMTDIPSIEFIISKCEKLSTFVEDLNHDFHTTVSIGVALLNDDTSYEDLFKKADDALYEAKKNGRAQVVIYGQSKKSI